MRIYIDVYIYCRYPSAQRPVLDTCIMNVAFDHNKLCETYGIAYLG